jgi:hypothetical protein
VTDIDTEMSGASLGSTAMCGQEREAGNFYLLNVATFHNTDGQTDRQTELQTVRQSDRQTVPSVGSSPPFHSYRRLFTWGEVADA